MILIFFTVCVLALVAWFLLGILQAYRSNVVKDLKNQLLQSEPVPIYEFTCPCSEQHVQDIPFSHNTVGYECSKCNKRISIIQTLDTALSLEAIDTTQYPTLTSDHGRE